MADDETPYIPAKDDRVSWSAPLRAGAVPTKLYGTVDELLPDGQVRVIPDVGGITRAWVVDPRSLHKEE